MSRRQATFFFFLISAATLRSEEEELSLAIQAVNARANLIRLGDRTTCANSCRSCLKNGTINLRQRKFFFCHIPKTAGFSVETDLRNVACDGHYTSKNLCFIGRTSVQFGQLALNSFAYRRHPSEKYGWKDFVVYAGHQPWGMLPGFVESEAPALATVLRDPLERALSHWNMGAGKHLGFDNNLNKSFSEAIRWTIETFGPQDTVTYRNGAALRNEMVYWLCGVNCTSETPLVKALDVAKGNLLKTAAIGLTEDMRGLQMQFEAILPWWTQAKEFAQFSVLNTHQDPKNVRRRGNHKKTQSLDDLDDWSRKKLTEFLWADIELYKFGRDLSILKSAWARSCAALVNDLGSCKTFIQDCH
jgi:hypothetical protein